MSVASQRSHGYASHDKTLKTLTVVTSKLIVTFALFRWEFLSLLNLLGEDCN